jgi:hypothetical protein
MTEGIAALIASAITGTVALLTVLLTNRGNNARLISQLAHEKSRSKAELLRQKGEELYELTSEWQQNLGVQCLSIQAVMTGDLSYNEALDMQINEVTPGKHHRLRLLVHAYFPDLLSDLDNVETKRDAVSKIRSTHKMLYKRGDDDGLPLLKPFTDANLALMEAAESLKLAAARLVRDTARVDA